MVDLGSIEGRSGVGGGLGTRSMQDLLCMFGSISIERVSVATKIIAKGERMRATSGA